MPSKCTVYYNNTQIYITEHMKSKINSQLPNMKEGLFSFAFFLTLILDIRNTSVPLHVINLLLVKGNTDKQQQQQQQQPNTCTKPKGYKYM